MAGKHAITPVGDEFTEWQRVWQERNPDAWMEPLRSGGTRVEREMRKTMRERGQMLAKRVSKRALRLRRALARGRS